MAAALTQQFPRREGERIVHRAWSVDLAAAARLLGRGADAARLRREAEGMSEHFPRWVLTVALGRERALCRRCDGLLVFDRGLRCVECGEGAAVPRGALLAWFGVLPPVGLEGLGSLANRIAARPPPGHVVGERAPIGRYLLIPLLAVYPTAFPERELRVHYLPGFFSIPGVPGDGPSHEVHLLGQGAMCLFAPGEWQPALGCREVLQQRAYAHAIKLLNFAAGRKRAFAIVS
jgi:hypothetical protein